MENVIRQTIVQACFDESGKLADSEIVAFGGCFGTEEDLDRLSERWKYRLHEDDLLHTSMKEAVHFTGSYDGWRNKSEKRDTVLKDLATMVVESGLVMISSPIATTEFKSLSEELRRKLWDDPQYAGLEACIMGILDRRPEFVTHVICDISEQYAERCVTLFNKLRKRNQIIKERCFAITFADDTKHPALQAADMIAYCSRADHMRATRRPWPIIDDLIRIFAAPGGDTRWVVYKAGGEGIGHAEIEPPDSGRC